MTFQANANKKYRSLSNQLIVLASVDSVLISFAMLDYSLVR